MLPKSSVKVLATCYMLLCGFVIASPVAGVGSIGARIAKPEPVDSVSTDGTTYSSAVVALAQADKVHVSKCKNARVRKEWRQMSLVEKFSYLGAVKCLQYRPAIGKKYFAPVKSRFDDFVALHINASYGMVNQTPLGGIHQVGVLLPWHRYTVWAYEEALRNECGYPFAQPYWDWTLDAANWAESPLFDPLTGFGGQGPYNETFQTNGSTPTMIVKPGGTGGSCVNNGYFQGVQSNLDRGNVVKEGPHCLVRNFNPGIAAAHLSYTPWVSHIIEQPDFKAFREVLDPYNQFTAFGNLPPGNLTVHGAGHLSIGGDMVDLYSAPIDPLFYLHHANLDRIWTNWQEKNLTRLSQMAGPTQPFTGVGNTTLDTMVWMGYSAVSLPVRRLMDTQNRDGNGPLCYVYNK